MKRYRVTFTAPLSWSYEVDADDADSAVDLAQGLFENEPDEQTIRLDSIDWSECEPLATEIRSARTEQH